MTGLIAAMTTAGQHFGASFCADVIEIDATFLVTLVFGAATHSTAALLTSCIIGSGLKLFAFHLLVHVAAAAFDNSRFITRRTIAQVAFGDTYVMSTRGATEKLLPTDRFTDWYRVQA